MTVLTILTKNRTVRVEPAAINIFAAILDGVSLIPGFATAIRIVCRAKMSLKLAVIRIITLASPVISSVKITGVFQAGGGVILKVIVGMVQTKLIVCQGIAQNQNLGVVMGNVFEEV